MDQMDHVPAPPPVEPGMAHHQELPGATAGLVLGICSIVFSMPLVGLVLAFVGLLKSKEARGFMAVNPGVYFANSGVAQAGFVCSLIGLILGCFTTLCGSFYILAIIMAIAAGAAAPGGYGY